jgi:hypothetical protein
VVETVLITLPRGERDAAAVEIIYADLLRRYPANFATG